MIEYKGCKMNLIDTKAITTLASQALGSHFGVD
jgi:hypothetical protein